MGKKCYIILNGAVKLYTVVYKRRPHKNDKPKWWISQIKAGLLQ